MDIIVAQALTDQAFAPFGKVIDCNRNPDFAINNGMCDRYHALAEAEADGEGAKTIISVGMGRPYPLPLKLEMVERHPFGSQAFIPTEPNPFLVIVAPDLDGVPGQPLAFYAKVGQGVHYYKNTWHGVLTPLDKPTHFIIVDRQGAENNLEEFFFPTPYQVQLA